MSKSDYYGDTPLGFYDPDLIDYVCLVHAQTGMWKQAYTPHTPSSSERTIQQMTRDAANKPKRRKLGKYPVTAEERRKSTQTCMNIGLISSCSDVIEAHEVFAESFKAADAGYQARDLRDGRALPTSNACPRLLGRDGVRSHEKSAIVASSSKACRP
eukprot:6469146-Amphidinium_carterae.1